MEKEFLRGTFRSESDIPQGQRDKGNHQHHARRHELFCLGQPHAEHNEQHGEYNVRDVGLEDNLRGAQAQRGSEAYRHDQ